MKTISSETIREGNELDLSDKGSNTVLPILPELGEEKSVNFKHAIDFIDPLHLDRIFEFPSFALRGQQLLMHVLVSRLLSYRYLILEFFLLRAQNLQDHLPSTNAPANESPAPVVSIASTFVAGNI